MADDQYLIFEREDVPGRKTPIVWVLARSTREPLGEIRWFGRWRQYCFFPKYATVFNVGCMGTIVAQIAELTAERAAKAAKA